MSYTHGMVTGKGFRVKEKEYKSWRIYFIFRALASNRQKPIKAKSKTHKSFCQTTFYHYLSHYVLCHENQGVTDLTPYKNLVPEIPKLGVERNTELRCGAVFTPHNASASVWCSIES